MTSENLVEVENVFAAARRLRNRGLPISAQTLFELYKNGLGPDAVESEFGLMFASSSVDDWADLAEESGDGSRERYRAATEDPDGVPDRRLRFLLAGYDRTDYGHLLRDFLGRWGFEVIGPTGAQESVRLSNSELVDLALVRVDDANVEVASATVANLLSKNVPFSCHVSVERELPEILTVGGPTIVGEMDLATLPEAVVSEELVDRFAYACAYLEEQAGG